MPGRILAALWQTFWRLFVGLLLSVVVLALNLPTELGRAAVLDVARSILRTAVPGNLAIGEVEVLNLSEIRVTGIGWRDMRNVPFAEGGTLSVHPSRALIGALLSEKPFPTIELSLRRAWIDAPVMPSAPLPGSEPPDNTPSTTTWRVPDIRVRVAEVKSRIGPPTTLHDVRLDGGVEVRPNGFSANLRRLDLRANVRELAPIALHLEATARSPMPPRVNADLTLRGRDVGCELHVNTAPDGEYRANIRGCRVARGVIDQVIVRNAQPPLPAIELDLQARVRPDLRWSAAADLRVERESLHLEGSGTADEQALTLRLRNVSPARAMAGLPEGDIDGVIRLNHRGEGENHHVVLDTRGLRGAVAEVPLPPFLASLTVRGEHVDVLSLRSDALGLNASGVVELSEPLPHGRLTVDIDSPELASMPWTRGLAGGRVRGRVTAAGSVDNLRASVRLDVSRLRVADIRAESIAIRGTLDRSPGRDAVDVTLNGRQVALRGTASADAVDARVRGVIEGQLDVNVDARGDGLLQALGPRPALTNGRGGPTEAHLYADVDLSNPARVGVNLRASRLVLRGAEASVSGTVALDRAGNRPPRVNLALTTPRSGGLTVGLAGDEVHVDAERFDFAWLHGLMPGLERLSGTLAGNLHFIPSAPGRSRADLRVERVNVPRVGVVNGGIILTPEGQRSRLQVNLRRAGEGNTAGVAVDALFAIPRDTGNVERWLRGVRNLEVELQNVRLEDFNELVPPPFLARGAIDLRLRGAPDASGALALTLGVEARGLVGGVDITAGIGSTRRLAPAVVPLRVRFAGCTALASLDLDRAPVTVRLAVARDYDEQPDGVPESCAAAGIDRPTLATVALDLTGPWSTALSAVAGEVSANHLALSARAAEVARRANVDLHATVGPFLRSQWPLRLIAIPRRLGPPLVIRPPAIPDDTLLRADLRTRGPLIAATTEVQLETAGSRVDPIGLVEPYHAEAVVELGPDEGSTLLERVGVNLAVLAQVSPALSREAQGRVEVDMRVGVPVARVVREGPDALEWRRFDVATEHLELQRFSWAQQRGLFGLVDARFRATGNPAAPIDATVNLRDIRTRLTDALATAGQATPRESARMQAQIHALASRAGDLLNVDTCLRATLRGEVAPCDPLHPGDPGTESLQATAHVPVGGSFNDLAVRLEQSSARLLASNFRLDAVSGFVPDDLMTNLGGRLDAAIDWRGTAQREARGTLRVTDGSATLTTLGEPMRNLNLELVASGTRVELRRLEAEMGRGSIHMQGNALVARNPWLVVSLQGRTNAFPVALSGYTWAWIDGAFRFGMVFRDEQARGNVEIETLRALVQEQPSVDLQQLDPDPNIYIVGRSRVRASTPARAYPIDLSIRTSSPVWLRRSDFTIAIRTNLRVRTDRAGLSLSENIELASNQSWFSIFGKRFDLDRVRVSFDGSVGINPELDIAAHYDSPTAGRLGVAVSGRLEHPTVTFSSTNYPTASQAEILAMIAIGRRDTPSSSASSDLFGQAGQAVLSLVSGLLATSLSREFSFLPTIIAEPGSGGGRYGAGVNLGPRVYLQATLSAAGATTGAAATNSPEFRVLLEYALNEAITISGSWSTLLNGRWGADVLWSP